MKIALPLLTLLATASALVTPTLRLRDVEDPAPLKNFQHPQVHKDRYIVYFKRDQTVERHSDVIGLDVTALTGYKYHDFIPGYVATFDSDTLHNKIRRDPYVTLVEGDGMLFPPTEFHAQNDTIGIRSNGPTLHSKRDFHYYIKQDPYYNQQMVSARDKLETPVGLNDFRYLSPPHDGNRVDVYIFDGGINKDHSYLRGFAYNFPSTKSDNDLSPYCGDEPYRDFTGHGTR